LRICRTRGVKLTANNFRFEDPDGDTVVTHAHKVEGSVRITEDKRKEKAGNGAPSPTSKASTPSMPAEQAPLPVWWHALKRASRTAKRGEECIQGAPLGSTRRVPIITVACPACHKM
jgi:hypothetical protein